VGRKDGVAVALEGSQANRKKSLTTTNAVSALLRLKHMTRPAVDRNDRTYAGGSRVGKVTSRGVAVQAVRSIRAEYCSFARGSQAAAGED
jgi:hypothetical protein